MASDADWVEDVRRWVAGREQEANPQPASDPGSAAGDAFELGYEAAHPALQARHWPDALDAR